VPNPQQLFAGEKRWGDTTSPRFSWPAVQDAQRELAGRAEIFATTTATGMQVRPGGRSNAVAERGFVQLVSGEFFQALRQQPQAGRLFTPADNVTIGGHPVVVISDGYWERHFARQPDAVGRELLINGTSFTIVGVAPAGFFGTFVSFRNPDVWIPLVMQPVVRYAVNASASDRADGRQPWPPQDGMEWLMLFARISDRAQAEGVASTLAVLNQRRLQAAEGTSAAEPDSRSSTERVVMLPAARGTSGTRDQITAPLVVLLAMVGVLLAIACGNVASLLLARASARDREIAIRLSIGAGRWRVMRQLIAETLLLAAIGGGLGLIAAAWGRDALLAMFSRGAATIDLDTSFDWRVLAFATGVTALAGLLSGVVPALRSTRVSLSDALKAQARTVMGTGGRRGFFVGKTLVAAQIAFSLLLLVMAALFMRSMQSLLKVDVGFDTDRVLAASIDVRSIGYSGEARQALYKRLVDRITSIPGVTSASLSMNGPLGRSQRTSSLTVEGYTPREGETLLTNEEVVTDAYFETVGLELVEGRWFGPEDRNPQRRASIINQTMARRLFPGTSPIGKRWNYGGPINAESFEVIGVVQDAKYVDLRRSVPNMIYRLAAASPDDVMQNIEVRTSMAPSQIAPTLAQVLKQAEPTVPVFDIVTLNERLNRGVSADRMIAQLTSAFGATALLLACLGLYGTISYGVTRRTTELGVRMALGAGRGNVLWLVIREAMVLVIVGGLIGVPLALAAGNAARSLLHGVGAADPVSFAAGLTALMAVSAVAAYLPAHRASRIDPMAALRKE
jgi:predicted permease